MTEVEQKTQGTAPFQEDPHTGNFFRGGGRGAIISDIKAAFNDKVQLITLIGEEGSGKTMLCKMLQEQWDTTHKIVFLPRIVESFEDVVRVVAQECDLQYPLDTSRADAKRIILDLVASLQNKNVKLLLLCDEAENMFLATLERIRKILDDVNAQGGGLQVFLAGRKNLGENMEQLALCDFQQIFEKQFFLPPLDEAATWSYLNFCVQRYRGTEGQEVFTREAAAKITSMSKGNFRLINMFADESLQTSSDDTSFLVLLDHVKDVEAEEDIVPSAGSGIVSRLPFPVQYVLGGGLILVLLLLIFLFGGDDKKPAELRVTAQDTTPVPVDLRKQSGVSAIEESDDIQVRENTLDPVADEIAGQESALEPAVDKGTVQESVSAPDMSQEEILEKFERIVPVESGMEADISRTPVEISPVEIIEKALPAVESEVPEFFRQSKMSAGKIKRISNPQLVLSQTQEKKYPVKPAASVDAGVPVVESAYVSKVSKDPVLGSFAAIGEKWQAGKMDSNFSIQLMSLKSEKAEENLKRIVSQPAYQAVADKLVILERPSDPPVFLLFYGIYPTMAAARNARNNMPIFLRDRHPYPISVRGAVEKAHVE